MTGLTEGGRVLAAKGVRSISEVHPWRRGDWDKGCLSFPPII